MALKIKMPKLSPDMTEGVLCQYMVEEGDVVEPGQQHGIWKDVISKR